MLYEVSLALTNTYSIGASIMINIMIMVEGFFIALCVIFLVVALNLDGKGRMYQFMGRMYQYFARLFREMKRKFMNTRRRSDETNEFIP